MKLSPLKVRRLEQILLYWEDRAWAEELARSAESALGLPRDGFINAGPLKHYHELRAHLREIKHFEDFDTRRFLTLLDQRQTFSLGSLIPTFLAAWQTMSRRVYHISADLQAILLATTLQDVTWGDIEFPFDCFALSLEVPLDAGDGEFDFLVFSPLVIRPEDQAQIPRVDSLRSLTEINSNFDSWRPFAHKDEVERRRKHDVAAAFRYAEKKGLITDVSNQQKRVRSYHGTTIINPNDGRNARKVVEQIESETSMKSAGLAWRLLINFCKWFEYQPVASPTVRAEVAGGIALLPKPQRGAPSFFGAPELFSVHASQRLSQLEREVFMSYALGRPTGIEVDCHFREGHWRRPPGFGQEPLARRTVHVIPTIVRPDRWTPSGPLGRKVTVH